MKGEKNILMLLVLLLGCATVIAPGIAGAGVAERALLLESLTSLETIAYVGNSGAIGMDDAANPSILFRLLDAKAKNDNSLIGSTDEMLAELDTFLQVLDTLVLEDDLEFLEAESEAATGFTFSDRLTILKAKMEQVHGLLQDSGINNESQKAAVVERVSQCIAALDDVISQLICVVHFADPGLEAAVRDAISKPEGPIYCEEVAGRTVLNADDRGIADLGGIEHLAALQKLYLNRNSISDLSPLADLTSLWLLRLESNQVSDVSPLAGLTGLVQLNLYNNQISDVSPLSGLTSLQRLNLTINQISDVSSLSGLTSLKTLYLAINQISDISPLAGLTSLQTLHLHNNQISDISSLEDLDSLLTLFLHNNQISDIDPLLDLLSLDQVDVRFNPCVEPTPDSAAQAVIDELEASFVTVIYLP